MPSRMRFALVLIALVSVVATGASIAQYGSAPTALPGSLGGGETLLPNGWRIAPAGRHMAIGDLPLNLVLSPDGRYLIVANNGYAKPTLRVVDLERGVRVVRPSRSTTRGWAWRGVRTARSSTRRAPRRTASSNWRGATAGSTAHGHAAARAQRARRRSRAVDHPSRAAEFRRRHRGEPGRRAARRARTCLARSVEPRRSRDGHRARRPSTCRPSRTRRSSRATARRCSSRSGAARACCCSTRRRSRRRARSPSASIRTRWCRPATAAAVRRVREHERRVGRRSGGDEGDRADLGRALSRRRRRDRRRTRSRSRRTAQRLLVANADNNTVAVVDVVERRARAASIGLHPDGLVSDGRRVQPATARRSTS